MERQPVKRSGTRPRRAYHSPKRAARALATRRRIRGAAEELFLQGGYSATSINAIAGAAGVALRTIFLAFPSKAALLSEIIQVAVRGDDQDLPVSGRKQWQAMLSRPADQLLAEFCAGTTEILKRCARLLELGELGADHDDELAALCDRGEMRMRSDFLDIACALADKDALVSDLDIQHAADTIYALANHQVYLRLTRECGWAPDQYTSWLSALLPATLLDSEHRAAPERSEGH